MIVTDRVDEFWGTDMAQPVTTQEGRFYVIIAVDICSGGRVLFRRSHSLEAQLSLIRL